MLPDPEKREAIHSPPGVDLELIQARHEYGEVVDVVDEFVDIIGNEAVASAQQNFWKQAEYGEIRQRLGEEYFVDTFKSAIAEASDIDAFKWRLSVATDIAYLLRVVRARNFKSSEKYRSERLGWTVSAAYPDRLYEQIAEYVKTHPGEKLKASQAGDEKIAPLLEINKDTFPELEGLPRNLKRAKTKIENKKIGKKTGQILPEPHIYERSTYRTGNVGEAMSKKRNVEEINEGIRVFQKATELISKKNPTNERAKKAVLFLNKVKSIKREPHTDYSALIALANSAEYMENVLRFTQKGQPPLSSELPTNTPKAIDRLMCSILCDCPDLKKKKDYYAEMMHYVAFSVYIDAAITSLTVEDIKIRYFLANSEVIKDLSRLVGKKSDAKIHQAYMSSKPE